MRTLLCCCACFLLSASWCGSSVPDRYTYTLYVFEGSDWCANCRRLEKTVLSDSAFVKILDANAIRLEKIDFPQRNRLPMETQTYNNAVAEKYAFDGVFPTLVLARTDAMRFQKIAYQDQSAEALLSQIMAKTEALK